VSLSTHQPASDESGDTARASPSHGQRNVFNHHTLDGTKIRSEFQHVHSFSIDALRIKVQTVTYPAEFGYAISQITVTTKSTNQIHGSLFEFPATTSSTPELL
jgi:hypothetical protein